MGLDMYLTRQVWAGRYMSAFEKNKADGKIELYDEDCITGFRPVFKSVRPHLVDMIQEQVCYWRKANHIHAWFVKNVQGGVDNCENYNVSIEQLQELVDTCKEVVNRKDKAYNDKHLPTRSGFFFGSTEYDDDYYEDCEHTIKILEAEIEYAKENSKENSMESDVYYYQSSW